MQIRMLTQASAGRGVVVVVGTLGMIEYRQIVPLEEARDLYRRLGDAILEAEKIDRALAPAPACKPAAVMVGAPAK